MRLQQIVVGADETEASRNAIRAALLWGRRTGARVSIISVSRETVVAPGHIQGSAARAIERWLGDQLADGDQPAPRIVEAAGIPSIEIARFAEKAEADLLILGRKPRSSSARRLLGDTADAVARRSAVPCLFVPGPDEATGPMLAALDGTDRGFAVLRRALDLAQVLGLELDLVTVERGPVREPVPGAFDAPAPRTENLIRLLGASAATLQVRRGDVVAEVLTEIEARQTRILVLGYRRGGPPGPVEGASVARRLAHRAPCAVLTIPL
jgi:nucleotide-binding universal stress UspA family protein